MIRLSSVLLAASVVGSTVTANAQESGTTSTWSVGASYTGDGTVKRHHVDYGELSTTLTRASYLVGWQPAAQWQLHAGPFVEWSHFDVPQRAPLPEDGYVTALQLGAVWQINERWTARAEIRPGLYTDYKDISFADFNAPFIAAVTYASSSNLLWVLGLGVNLRSDLGTIGGPGVRWHFADQWTLNLILPKPTIDYAITESLGVYAGGEWRSTSFRVSENFGAKYGLRRLNDDDFSYRELRGLAGIRWNLSRSLRVDLEGGYAFDRRAEYRDAEVTFKADAAPYVQVGLGGTF